jgi:hypothetical protein
MELLFLSQNQKGSGAGSAVDCRSREARIVEVHGPSFATTAVVSLFFPLVAGAASPPF